MRNTAFTVISRRKKDIDVCGNEVVIIMNSFMMQARQKTVQEFFRCVNSLQDPSGECSFTTLSCFFKEEHSGSLQNKIVLKDTLLLVSTAGGPLFEPTHGLQLEDGIRFRRLCRENGQMRGFRLFDSKGSFVDVLIAIVELAELWVKHLSKLISEIGFSDVFETLRRVGRGSTACVYEVVRRSDQRLFAVKVVLKSYLRGKEERGQALQQEVALLRAIEHQNVIQLEGVFESEQAVYLVFERLSGGTLLERINKTGGLSGEEVRQVMQGIAKGLNYLHRFDIAHRDLKLENILLRDPSSLHPVIADFGLAVLAEEEPYLYYRCGTPGYVAPEIIRMKENRPVSVACDIFSAGVIFHVLLTNTYLFPGSSSQEVYRLNCQAKVKLNGDIYKQIDPVALGLLRRMLTVRVSQRISAQEMLEDEFLQEEEEELKEVSPAVTEVGETLCL